MPNFLLFSILILTAFDYAKTSQQNNAMYFQLHEDLPRRLYQQNRKAHLQSKKKNFESKNGIPQKPTIQAKQNVQNLVSEIKQKKLDQQTALKIEEQKGRKLAMDVLQILDKTGTLIPGELDVPTGNWAQKGLAFGSQVSVALTAGYVVRKLRKIAVEKQLYKNRGRARTFYLNSLREERQLLKNIIIEIQEKPNEIYEAVKEFNDFLVGQQSG